MAGTGRVIRSRVEFLIADFMSLIISALLYTLGCIHSVAEWLACWTQVQKGPGSNRSHDAVGVTVLGKLFTPIVPLFTKQQNW